MALKISESAAVQMPMKTVASLITIIAIGTWAYFGIHEKLNQHSTKIELMHPFGESSPIKNFLEKNINGAMHHICIEVKNINEACDEIKKQGVRVLGDGVPKIGAHNKPVIFLHPKDFFGTLIELEQE